MNVASAASDCRIRRKTPSAASATDGQKQPICLESLAEGCLDDGPACGMILHKFAARSDDQLAALARALESGNAAALAREACTLKGVAATLSAEKLCGLADQLERTARRGALAEAPVALARTCDEIERCVAAAGELLDQLLDD